MLAVLVPRFSPVVNEPGHLSAGIVHIRFGQFDLFRVNPPLFRLTPALTAHAASPEFAWHRYEQGSSQRLEGNVGWDFMQMNASRASWIVTVARWGCIPFALIGAWMCLHWSTVVYGSKAGMMAFVLWCFSPYFLGHLILVAPDGPAAAMSTAAVFCFWRWLKRPGWLEVIITGLVLGLAELCKFTLLILYPVLPALWILYRLPEWRAGTIVRNGWLRQGGMLIMMVLFSIYIINCGYLFERTLRPLEEFRFQTTLFTGRASLDEVPLEGANRFSGTWLGKLPVPFPASMVEGIDTQRRDFEKGLPSYLRGQWADHGWWCYYLYALGVKMPLGTWCLAFLALGVTVFARGYNAPWRDEIVVLLPGVAILVFVSSQTGFSVHSRYVIPALPFFFVWTSKVGRVFDGRRDREKGRSGKDRVNGVFSPVWPMSRSRRAVATMCVVAITWTVGSSLWACPHSLSYFNELVGGPKGGGEHLLDSNIDWGQDLLYLRKWLDGHPDVRLNGLAYRASYPASLAGIPGMPSPPPGARNDHVRSYSVGRESRLGPQPGWYALSVNCLYDRDEEYRYFIDYFEPVASAGYSIYVYHITLDEANRVRQECGLSDLTVSSRILDREEFSQAVVLKSTRARSFREEAKP
jgi:hypothetical protein